MASPSANRTATYKGKVVIVGDYSCGKTSLVHRYVSGQYLGIQEPTIAAAFQTRVVDLSAPTPSIQAMHIDHVGPAAGSGAAAKPRRSAPGWMPVKGDDTALETRNATVKLELWDTAGSERYQSLMPMYFRDALVAIVVFDVTRRDTFDRVRTWIDAYRAHNDRQSAAMMRPILVATKCDLYRSVQPGEPSKDLTSAHDEPQVTLDDAIALATELGVPLCFSSAKAAWNVDVLFRHVADHVAAVCEERERLAAGGKPTGRFGLKNGALGSSPASVLLRQSPPDHRDAKHDEEAARGGKGDPKKRRAGPDCCNK